MFNHMSKLIGITLAITIFITEVACGQNTQPAQTADDAASDQTTDGVAKSQLSQVTGTAAGVWWDVPGRWIVQPDRSMRIATYQIPVVTGDQEPGECAVYFFGAGQGGDVEANVTRWQSQFAGTDGGPASLSRKQSKVNGLSVTTVSIVGTYLASMGPMVQTGAVKKPVYRMLGAIIEAPDGNVFIKFTGPEKTIAAAEKEFQKLVDSMRK